MHHLVTFVAETQRLDKDKFVEFAKTHRGAFFDETGDLLTSTMLVDELINDFLAAGNERLPYQSKTQIVRDYLRSLD